MRLLDKLEKIFGRLAISNLALYFVIGQAFVLFAIMLGQLELKSIVLVPAMAFQGEWWRFITFLFVPPEPDIFGMFLGRVFGGQYSYVFAALAWYVFFMMGRALEDRWGTFRFNLFVLVGWFLTVAVSLIVPWSITGNAFLAGSVFLAFAFLFPNFEMLLFFILPVKIKWLALVAWIGFAFALVVGNFAVKLQVLAAVGNFLLFFGADIIRGLRNQRRSSQFKAAREEELDRPRHECRICGKTDRTHPQMDFRYCSKCAGDECYCSEHIGNHVHVTTVNEPKN